MRQHAGQLDQVRDLHVDVTRRALRPCHPHRLHAEPARGALERIAKEAFYPERAYPLILARACREGVAPAACDRLGRWLPSGRIDQKRFVEYVQELEQVVADALSATGRAVSPARLPLTDRISPA